jgi:pimeloyl-ACP methyl ester carboxylesterase
VSRLQVPLLIVHGTEDETVPLHQAEELHLQNPENATLIHIEGADHTFGSAHPFNDELLPAPFQQVVNKTVIFLKESY